MVVKHGDLFAEAWERANGSWCYVVCPGSDHPVDVAEALSCLSWRPFSDADPDLYFERIEEGIWDRRKRWWSSGDDFGTAGERAFKKACESLASLAVEVDRFKDERERREGALRVEI